MRNNWYGKKVLLWLSAVVVGTSILWVWFSDRTVLSAVPAAMAACTNLGASISNDKNYYIFTATAATDPAAKVEGYAFDFGDRETYNFFFDQAHQNRTQAVATHTYQNDGTYTVTARLLVGTATKDNSKPGSCKTMVTVGQSPMTQTAVLVNTGPGNIPAYFLTATVIGMIAHGCFYNKRRR